MAETTVPAEWTETVEAEGHLVDSQLLGAIFDRVSERHARFEVRPGDRS